MADKSEMETGTSPTTRMKYQASAETVSDYSEDPSRSPPHDDQPTLSTEAPAAEEGGSRNEDGEGEREAPKEEDATKTASAIAAASAVKKADKTASKTRKRKAATSSNPVSHREAPAKQAPQTLASTREKRRHAGEKSQDAVGTGRRDDEAGDEAGMSTDAAVASKKKTASKAVPSKTKTRPYAKTGTRPIKSARKATTKATKEAAHPDDARVDDAYAADAEDEASGANAQEDNVGVTDAEHEVPEVNNEADRAATSTSDMATAIETFLRHGVTVADTFVSYTRARNEDSEADAANARFSTALKRNRSGGEPAAKKRRDD